jgi:glycosyltransferase involved in cell wall biosynthesis
MKRGIEHAVTVTGRVPFEEIGAYLKQARVGWVTWQPVPNNKKNIPTKLFEYMAYRIPIVSSDLPSIRSFVNDGENGYRVTADDPEAHAQAILSLLRQPEMALAMGKRGQEMVRTCYNWDEMERRLLALYETLSIPNVSGQVQGEDGAQSDTHTLVQDNEHPTRDPFVTVIMPIRNESEFIQHSLGAVLAQEYPADRLEILVVDGMSNDGTRGLVREMLTEYLSARLIDNPRFIAAAALNIGIAEAKGEAVVRVDGHTIIAPDYVRRCVDVLVGTEADCVGGLMNAEGNTAFGEAIALATSTTFGVGDSHFHYAAQPQEAETVYLGAWPLKLFASTGFFRENVGCNEDDEFNYRLRANGGHIWLDPSIRSTYYPRSTLRALWRQYFRYGYYKIRVFQEVPGSAQLRHWVPPLFALAVTGGLPVALLLPFLRPLYLGGLLLYALVNLFVSARIAARAGWRHLFRLPLAFASLHLAYGLGFWVGIVRFGPPWRKERHNG